MSGIEASSATLDGAPVTKGQVINLAAMAGNHKFTLVALDKAGNQAPSSIDFVVSVAAAVDIDPDTLNPKGQGGKNAFTAYIEFPPGYDVGQINVATVKLTVNGTAIPAQLSPTNVGDYDSDRIADRMVKFDRQAVIAAVGSASGDITMTVSGSLNDGRGFMGSDVIKVLDKGK